MAHTKGYQSQNQTQTTSGNVNTSQSVQRTIKSKLLYNTIHTSGVHLIH